MMIVMDEKYGEIFGAHAADRMLIDI